MKNVEMFYINEQHKDIVEEHINSIKRLMYFATENVGDGKYHDYLDILNSIYLYSNNFYNTMLDKTDTDGGVVAEFIFLIPNMSFYSSIGFLTALRDGDNNSDMKMTLEKIGLSCENTISELADILMDESEKKNILKDLPNIKINQN
tara:strand:- start:3725 stop:4165 length:441 start_codon:yes stop_codon:yes gene_type:complete